MDEFVKPLIQEIHSAAHEYEQKKVVEPIDFQGYPAFMTTGKRQAFESQYFRRRRQFAVLVIENYLNSTSGSMKLLENVIWEICNEFTWAVPAHVPTKNDLFTKDSRTWIDLFAAETAQSLAEGKSLLGDKLSPMISARIDAELNARIFQPFVARTWFWETMPNNWSSVVPGSVGMAALLQLQKSSPLQKEIIGKVSNCLDNYLATFAEDGACTEGIGYWTYGFGYFIYYAEMYRRVLKDNKYFEMAKVKKIAAFPYKTMQSEGRFVPFSDYTGNDVPYGLISFCEAEFNIPAISRTHINSLDSDNGYRFAHIFRNVIWSKKNDVEQNRMYENERFYFDNAQWLIERNRKHNYFLAIKAGNNNESHNHNDVGNIVLGSLNELFVTDLGAGEYTTPYFAEATRYSFLTTSSRGHSVPIINQQYQRAGDFKATQVEESEQNFQFNLEAVYPVEAKLKKFNRCVTNVENSQIVLTDTFEFVGENNTVTENFVSKIKPQIRDTEIIIGNDETQLIIAGNFKNAYFNEEYYLDHRGIKVLAYLVRIDSKMSQQGVVQLNFELIKRGKRN